MTTPAGTAVSDGFPWINRLIRLFGTPEPRLGRGGVRLAPRLRDRVHVRRRHRHAGLRAHRLPAALGPQPREHVSGPGDGGRRGDGAWCRARRRRPDVAPGRPTAPTSGCGCGPAPTARWRWAWPAVMIAEGWYDAAFIRDWSNGALLVRDDTGRFLTAADLGAGGAATQQRGVGPGARRGLSSTTRGRALRASRVEAPLLLGSCACATRDGAVRCRPAFERYAALCRDVPARARRGHHRRRRRADRRDRAPALGAPAGGVLPLDRARAAHQRQPDGARACRCSTRSPAAGTPPAATSGPRGPRRTTWRPLTLLSEAQRAKALGLAERPLGPARLGLGDRRRPVPRDLARHAVPGARVVGFGANLLLSPAGRRRGARGAVPAGFPRLRRPLPHADGGAGRRGACRCPPPGSAKACASASVPRTRASATSSCAARSCRRAARRARTSGSSASWRGGWASAIASSAATRTPATTSCWRRPA